MARVLGVGGADDVRVRDVVRPVDAEGPRGAAQPGDRTVGGRGQGAEDAGAGGGHEVGGGHAGEQRDLGVPAVGGERRPVGEGVRVVALDDLLLGDAEGDPAALRFEGLAEPSDLAEEREGLLGRAGVDLPLHARVVELGAAADEGAPDVGGDPAALGVEVDAPEERGAGFAGEEAGGALGEDGGVEGDLAVGEVEGEDPPVGLGVERGAGCDEGGDVGDGVVDAVAAVGPPGQVHGLVEVGGGGRVDREERQVGGVVRGKPGVLRGGLGLGEDRGREGRGDRELGTECAQGGPQRSLGCAGHVDVAAGHGPSVWRGVGCGTS
ncbi:hypothetical protein SNARM312S_07438 [Streptomyces narbonensis]